MGRSRLSSQPQLNMTLQESEIPHTHTLDGTQRTFIDIHNVFGSTLWGDKLKRNVRYGPFKSLGVSNKDWEKALGGDVNNFEHLRLTYGLTRWFIGNSPGLFTEKEKELLLLTSIVHDWGEAMVGDIPYPVKTQQNEEEEMRYLGAFIVRVLGKPYKAIVPDIQKVLTDKESKLGKAFNAIEKIGYVRTGIKAWQESRKVDGVLGERFVDMGHSVVPRTLADLVVYSEEYPSVFLFLNSHRAVISEVIESTAKTKYKGEAWFKSAQSSWTTFGTIKLPLEFSSATVK